MQHSALSRVFALLVAGAAAAAPAAAQTTVTGSTFGCFGLGCVATGQSTAVYNVPGSTGGSVTFTGASFTGTTNPFTGGFSVSNFGSFMTAGSGGSNFSTPFTLLFAITSPTGASSPVASFTVGGNLGASTQTRDVSYTFNGAPVNFTFAGGSGTISLDNGFVGSNNAATITGRVTASVVPEPSTYALMATGILGLVGTLARRRNDRAA